jgi:hypothetical protein
VPVRTFPDSALVVVARDVLASEFGAEHVLLNLKNGTYYGVEDIGGEIWRMLQQPVPFGTLCSAMTDAFDVDAETCRQDLNRFISDLIANGLVEVAGTAP